MFLPSFNVVVTALSKGDTFLYWDVLLEKVKKKKNTLHHPELHVSHAQRLTKFFDLQSVDKLKKINKTNFLQCISIDILAENAIAMQWLYALWLAQCVWGQGLAIHQLGMKWPQGMDENIYIHINILCRV